MSISRRMMPLALAAGLTFGLATAAFAQETTGSATAASASAKADKPAASAAGTKGRAGAKGGPNASVLFKAAEGVDDLTAEQKETLKKLKDDYAKQLKQARTKVRKEAGSDKKKVAKEMRTHQAALSRKFRKEIEKGLTADQKKQFSAAVKKAAPGKADGQSTGTKKAGKPAES